jgi:hypothetical protein
VATTRLGTIKIRLIKKFYLIVARGAAKSMFAALIQAYFMTVDTSTTHQITTAPTMKQAEEVMSPFRTAITRSRGPLFKFLTEGSMQNTTGNRMLRQKLASTKKGIENFLTGSLLEIRPMAINKLQGLRTKIATIDEWLSGDLREDVIGAVEQGASKLEDYLIIAISSEGTVRNGSGDTSKWSLRTSSRASTRSTHLHLALQAGRDRGSRRSGHVVEGQSEPRADGHLRDLPVGRRTSREGSGCAQRHSRQALRHPDGGLHLLLHLRGDVGSSRSRVLADAAARWADASQGDDFWAFTFLFPLGGDRYGVKTRSTSPSVRSCFCSPPCGRSTRSSSTRAVFT